jgi:hypothetical protein
MIQKIKLLAFFLILAGSTQAQSFFSPLPKKTVITKSAVGRQVETKPADMTAFRPVINVASYLIGSTENALLSGGGVSYQKLTYNESTGKWTSVWSINALAWGKVALNGTPDTKNFLYGLAVGAFNNLILVGAATDGKKIYPTAGFGINLNN